MTLGEVSRICGRTGLAPFFDVSPIYFSLAKRTIPLPTHRPQTRAHQTSAQPTNHKTTKGDSPSPLSSEPGALTRVVHSPAAQHGYVLLSGLVLCDVEAQQAEDDDLCAYS